MYMLYNKNQTVQDVRSNVYSWLQSLHLHLNVSKTVCFSQQKPSADRHPAVFVLDFKYLGVITDLHLCFKQQGRGTVSRMKFNMSNFRHIRNN